jgi:hypothetical protein
MTKRIPWYSKYKVNLPEGKSGDWVVRQITVSPKQAEMDAMRGLFSGHGRCVPAGTYMQLLHKGEIVMSDTPDEIKDHTHAIHEASRRGGHVIINGLGLGMVAAAVARMDNVEKVTVIELSEDVIKLVEPTLTAGFGDKIEVIHANSLEYKPERGTKFSVAWHDIWPSICEDNLPEMATLNRRYGNRAEWQGAWAQDLCKKIRRESQSTSVWGW